MGSFVGTPSIYTNPFSNEEGIYALIHLGLKTNIEDTIYISQEDNGPKPTAYIHTQLDIYDTPDTLTLPPN